MGGGALINRRIKCENAGVGRITPRAQTPPY